MNVYTINVRKATAFEQLTMAASFNWKEKLCILPWYVYFRNPSFCYFEGTGAILNDEVIDYKSACHFVLDKPVKFFAPESRDVCSFTVQNIIFADLYRVN